MLKRLDLPDGQWADLLVKPRHAEYIAVKEALEDALRGRDSVANYEFVMGREFTKGWRIRAEDGTDVAFGDWATLDPDISETICNEAHNRWLDWDESRIGPLVKARPRVDRATPAPSSADTSEETPSP